MAKAGWLSTHILDTANGCPGAGISVRLYGLDGDSRELIKQAVTNLDGRTDEPLLGKEEIYEGWFELEFEIADYFAKSGNDRAGVFLGTIPLRFNISDAAQHYHVPLLVSPFSYSTYRGS